MKDNEVVISIKKEIKKINEELDDCAAQLGGVFYDSPQVYKESNTIEELNKLEESIPAIKERMQTLQSYNLSISEATESIKECNTKISDINLKIESVLEKIGVELYCFIGEKELAYSKLSGVYHELKEGEAKSESLETNLYKLENNVSKNLANNIFSKPFKIRSIKADIKNNNKKSLKLFRELGRIYTEIPQLIDQETNESLLDILNEFKSLKSSYKSQDEKRHTLNERIKDNEEKLKEGSNGIRLKTLYNKLEHEIVESQNKITEKLIELGHEIAKNSDLDITDENVLNKLSHYRAIEESLNKQGRELLFYEKRILSSKLLNEISERKNAIKIEEDHIASLNKKLNSTIEELNRVEKESGDLLNWLNENSLDS